jgi:hypothetical protein
MLLSQKLEYQKALLTKCYLTWHKSAIGYAYCLYHKTQPSVPASMKKPVFKHSLYEVGRG